MDTSHPAPASDAPLSNADRAVVWKERVDLRRPLVAQMGALGDDYDGWVHSPISPARAGKVSAVLGASGESSPDARAAGKWPSSLRMFRNPVLESLSHVSWWLILVVWVPVVLVFFLSAVGRMPGLVGADALSWLVALGWFVVGVATWTLMEYGLHRFAFHYRPKSAFGRRLHFLSHGVHHLDPWDATRLVFPPVAGVVILALIFGGVRLLFPLPQTFAIVAGILTGYVTYDMTHYYAHHGRPTSRWGKFLKTYHLAHHHKDWDAMYGVSSPAWDIVFRTTPKHGATKAATKRRRTTT